MYAPVTIDDIVIAYHLEFSLLVPSVYLGYRHIPTFGCGRAMHDDFVYFSHDFEKVENPLRCIPAAKGCDLTNVLKENMRIIYASVVVSSDSSAVRSAVRSAMRWSMYSLTDVSATPNFVLK